MPTSRPTGLSRLFIVLMAALLAAPLLLTGIPGAGVAPVAAADNPITVENALPGNPASEWDVSGAGDPSIQGFATDISVDQGETVDFKIDTTVDRLPDRHLPARLLRRGRRAPGRHDPPSARHCRRPSRPASISRRPHHRRQPRRLRQLGRSSASGRCRRRGLRHLHRPADRDGRRRRPPATSPSSSATTTATPTCCSRPPTRPGRPTTATAATASTTAPARRWRPQGQLQPAVHDPRRADRGLALQRRVPDGPLARAQRLRRQLLHRRRLRPPRRRDPRAQGLHVGRPRRVLVGRTARERRGRARDAGVNLAFFSGNEIYWKTRWEPSTADGGSTDYRTLVIYKEGDAQGSPSTTTASTTSTATRTRRLDRPLATEPDGPRRRAARERPVRPDQLGRRDDGHPGPGRRHARLRFWRNTGMSPARRRSTADTLGYEFDWEQPAYAELVPARPDHAVRHDGAGSGKNHKMSLYRAPSGALVFGAGTVQWSWGLDGTHDRGARRADDPTCSRPPSTSSPTWAPSPRRSRRA